MNGSPIVVTMIRGMMQEVEVDTGRGTLVVSAGAELTSLTRVMREARTELIRIVK